MRGERERENYQALSACYDCPMEGSALLYETKHQKNKRGKCSIYIEKEERERERECVCVCVCEREREREIERGPEILAMETSHRLARR